MGSILSLGHYGRSPRHLSEDDGAGCSKSETLGSSCNREESNPDSFTFLEKAYSLMSVLHCNTAIDADEWDFLLSKELVNAVHEVLVVGEEQELAIVLEESLYEVCNPS